MNIFTQKKKNILLTPFADTDCIRALEYRQGDKQAKDFLKKIKQKLSTS